MKNELMIAGIQSHLMWENPAENRNYFEEKINSLSDEIDIVVLPEMFTSGFTMNAQKVAEKMDGATISWMQKLASKNNLAIVGSLVIEEENHFYNRLVFVHPSKKIDFYDKHHTFTLAGEDKIYTSGKKKTIIDFLGWRICGLICYDVRFPVWARNTENYDLLLYMASWPIARIKAWDTLLKARAIENMSYVIGVNRIGKDDNGNEYCGNSLLIDYLGNQLSDLQYNEEGIIVSKINKKDQENTREKLGFLKDKDSFSIDL
jgi:predicted amidohydrolase